MGLVEVVSQTWNTSQNFEHRAINTTKTHSTFSSRSLCQTNRQYASNVKARTADDERGICPQGQRQASQWNQRDVLLTFVKGTRTFTRGCNQQIQESGSKGEEGAAQGAPRKYPAKQPYPTIDLKTDMLQMMKAGDDDMIDDQAVMLASIQGDIKEMTRTKNNLRRFAAKVSQMRKKQQVGQSMVQVSKALGQITANMQLDKVGLHRIPRKTTFANGYGHRWRRS